MFNDSTLWPATLAQASGTDTSPPPGAAPGNVPAAEGTSQTPGDGAATGGDEAPPSGGMGSMFLPLILVFVVLMMFTMGGGRKEKKRRAELMASLSKGSKVQTAGGVRGTIVEVREDEVVVKVDENSNTRMVFAKTAVNTVLSD